MNKIILIIGLIGFTIIFTGCVEEETVSPVETPAVDETVDATPTSAQEEETVLPSPTPEATVELPTLKPGYEWYQNDDLGYTIAYPDNWGTLSSNSGFSIYPQEFTSIYGAEEPVANYVSIYVWVSSNPNDSRFWESGVFVDSEVPIGLEELKEQGWIIEYKDITINGKDGIEVVFDPMKLYLGPEALTLPTTTRYVLFTSNDLDYIIQTKSSNDFNDEYKDTFEYVINSFIIN